MSKILEEIFFSLIFLNGILGIITISFKIFIKLWFSINNIKKDDEGFEKRWDDCE